MFKSKNFCHIASNNRNQVKVGVFVYRTTDSLETVSQSGYFNERIIDINLHDLIIHEKIDAADNTKVQRNVLCVSQRTLDNVGTVVVKSQWEADTEEELADLAQYVDNTFVRKDGTSIMTGPLRFDASGQSQGMTTGINPNGQDIEIYYEPYNQSKQIVAKFKWNAIEPGTGYTEKLGSSLKPWGEVYASMVKTGTINNGYDISVPVTHSADTLALKSQVDDAANSGEQLYTTGVWYAKMYAATTVPTGAEYDGRNYADFSQVDSDNNPIIVIYEGQSGTWVELTRITPPAAHNGYMTITSKIWDIVEQSGQQGGQVLWSHTQKTFTPYPRIISFDGANITNSTITTSTFSGTATLDSGSTMTMPVTPTNDSLITKGYLDSIIGTLSSADLFDFKWRDATTSAAGWKNANDYGWITQTEAPSAYNHLYNDLRATQTGEVAELGNNTWAAIVFDGTQYIAISETGYVSTSTDGTTWATATQDANLASLYDGTWRAIDYDGTIFVALGENGYISTSSDGTTWSAPTQVSNLGANTWRGLAYGNSTWVAISDGGYISTSSDGTTWSVATQNSDLGSHLWNDVIYDGTKFVALGNTGYLSTSTNGTTWAASYKGTNIGSKAWKNMTFAGIRYVVVGLAGWITKSTDLINWTTPVQPLGANQWRGIVYNGNSDVIAISQTGYIGFSADNGFSWYMAATTETETIAGITITFSRAPDGHKIITPDQTSNAEAIYAATGVAWYYIIDTAHLQFKLPRVNPNRELINASAPVLTDELKDTYINTHLDGTTNTVLATPVYDNGAVLYAYDRTVATGNQNTNLKADLANSTGYYQGKQYLYFYVGE